MQKISCAGDGGVEGAFVGPPVVFRVNVDQDYSIGFAAFGAHAGSIGYGNCLLWVKSFFSLCCELKSANR